MSVNIIIPSILTITLTLIGLWMALWVYRADKKSKSNIYLSILIILGILFIFIDYISFFTNPSQSLQIERVVYGVATIALGVLYLFSLNFPEKSKHNKVVTTIVVAYTLFFTTASVFSNQIISRIISNAWGVEIVGGNLEPYYAALSIIIIITVIYTNLRHYGTLSAINKQKVRLFFLGIVFFITSEAISVLVLPLFNLDRFSFFGDYSIIVFFGLTAYAIVKHHLFDIKLALVRSATYSLVLATLAGIYLVIAFVISAVFNSGQTSTSQIISGVVISLLLAFIFQPLKRFFDKITNRV